MQQSKAPIMIWMRHCFCICITFLINSSLAEFTTTNESDWSNIRLNELTQHNLSSLVKNGTIPYAVGEHNWLTEVASPSQPNLPLVKTLKLFKLTDPVSGSKKKSSLPGIVLQNVQDKQLNEDISDDLTKFEAYSKLLSQLMHSIANKELGVQWFQQQLDKLQMQQNTMSVDKLLDNITDKVLLKIDDIHNIIEITGERIEELYHQQFSLDGNKTYYSCCDYYASEARKTFSANPFAADYDLKLLNNFKNRELEAKNSNYYFDSYFDAWINKQTSCDIGDEQQQQSPYYFSPSGSNLTKQFEANLGLHPNIKWQYFVSFTGVQTEYPSYLPPNNYCFLHSINAEQNHYRTTNKRNRMKSSKKHDPFHHHRKAYNELNQLFLQRHRENLLNTALPQSKLVVIIVDRGSALTDHQLAIAKTVAKYILNSLSHKDKVALVDLTSTVRHPTAELCASTLEVAYANYETKHYLNNYIDEMQRSHNSTNHHLGFERAFQIIAHNYQTFKDEIGVEPEIFIPYISRGLLASLADAKPVMELIAKELKNSLYSFVINCYALIDESKPIMYEAIFLKEIATMNFKKFNVLHPPPDDKIKIGEMVELNNTENLGFLLNGIYDVLNKKQADEWNYPIYISLPGYDFISKDAHVSISKPFFYENQFLGVVGADVSFMDLFEDVIYFDHRPDSYVFLMDFHSGKLLYHPMLSHLNKHDNKYGAFSIDLDLQNSFTNAEHLEQNTEFMHVRQLMKAQHSGSHTSPLSAPLNGEHNQSYFAFMNVHNLSNMSQYSSVSYHWRRVEPSSFVIVFVQYQPVKQCASDGFTNTCTNHYTGLFNYTGSSESLQYVSHRLDYLVALQRTDIKLCKHFNQLATTDSASLFLTSDAFSSPYGYQREFDSLNMVQQYMDYLTDRTTSVANPGLRAYVRSDVNLAARVVPLWKELFETSEASKYIVRKYVATVSGTFITYPGALIDQSYAPKTRPWYSKAIDNPNKLVFIPPYLDIGGAGYIVTISRAIFAGKANGAQSNRDAIWAVMAVDLTLGYFHKIIDEMVSICSSQKSSCFIMDNFGYLIIHSAFLKPTLMPFIERQHITHKEPQMVNDLLNQKNFVRKLVCNSFTDRTIQRFYMFNNSLTGILTNIVHNYDAPCAKYKLISLDGSNAFFGIVNHSCDNSTTFCPCSLMDRLCLNCHRMEQTDCECPCECPLVMNMCTGQLVEKEDQNAACLPVEELLREPNVPKYIFGSLDSCVNSECFNKHSESECKGVLSCEWCSVDNGVTLKKPFCSSQSLCFGGIYGSKNPYLSNVFYHHYESYKPPNNPPIGPITISAFICIILLILLAYCMRRKGSINSINRYPNSDQPDQQILQQSHEPAENEFHNPEGGNFEAMVSLVQERNEPIASPYQFNSNYRRAPARVESDYGYSSMTPNDDSELNGPIYLDAATAQVTKKELSNLDLLNISNSPTLATASVASSDISNMSSPSSSSSSITASVNKRLPPPPFKALNKVRSKQKYIDANTNTQKGSSGINLPTVKESSLLEIEVAQIT